MAKEALAYYSVEVSVTAVLSEKQRSKILYEVGKAIELVLGASSQGAVLLTSEREQGRS